MKVCKYEVVEVPITSSGRSWKFPDLPNLWGKKIQQIQVYTITTVPLSPVSGNALVSNADLKNLSLTLQVGSDQTIQNRPALDFNPVVDGTNPYTNFMPEIDGLILSWDKCKVTSAAAQTGGVVLLVGIYYYDESAYEDKSPNAR